MSDTLYKRCPNCDQFNPEAEQVCTHCGHTLESPPSKSLAKSWWIRGTVLGLVILVFISSFILEGRLTPDSSPSSVVSNPTWTNTPPFSAPTPTPTFTPQPTRTPKPTPIVRIDRNMNVRGGPGTYYPIVGSASPGQQFPITGKNPVSDWWQINYQGLTAWIYAPLVIAVNADSVQIPVVIPVPLTSAQIFNKVSPAVAFVQTADATGSGVLVERGYVVTKRSRGLAIQCRARRIPKRSGVRCGAGQRLGPGGRPGTARSDQYRHATRDAARRGEHSHRR